MQMKFALSLTQMERDGPQTLEHFISCPLAEEFSTNFAWLGTPASSSEASVPAASIGVDIGVGVPRNQGYPARPPGGSVFTYPTSFVSQDPSPATSSVRQPLNLQLLTCFASGHVKATSRRTGQMSVLLTQKRPTSAALLDLPPDVTVRGTPMNRTSFRNITPSDRNSRYRSFASVLDLPWLALKRHLQKTSGVSWYTSSERWIDARKSL
ncbi:uncharacterized protein [Dermacentor albipictus]|uniref:uncharacterized protein n=1 Tax=Dermacentor albipictus TaxID=60249 RepID=UPI0038FC3F75